MSAGGDDDMAALLGTLHAAPSNALVLKTHILKALLACLRESHRTRTVFRKVCIIFKLIYTYDFFVQFHIIQNFICK